MPRGVNDFDTGRIQGRNVGDANSSNIVSPGIVTDGLVLHLDAGNYQSYPIAGTTWYDLSDRRNNGTLTNGPTFNANNGGSIVFDGTNDEVVCTGSITATELTFLVWLRRDGNQNAWAGILFSRGTNVTGMNYRDATNQLGYHWNDTASSYSFVTNLTPPDQTWCMAAVSVNPTTAVFYLCQSSGITTVTNTISHASTTLNSVRVFRDSSGALPARYAKGSVAQASIYNRALSAPEVSQNFNALRARFNI